MSYRASADLGRVGEDFVRELMDAAAIENSRNCAESLEELTGWDIKCTLFDLPFTIEVKFDAMEAKTGNIAVEYHNSALNKPSGIMATTSALWLIVLQKPMTAWVCNSDELRAHLTHGKCLRDIRCAGDGNASLKLYRRRELFEELFCRIDELSPWELRDTFVNLLGDDYVKARDKNLACAV